MEENICLVPVMFSSFEKIGPCVQDKVLFASLVLLTHSCSRVDFCFKTGFLLVVPDYLGTQFVDQASLKL